MRTYEAGRPIITVESFDRALKSNALLFVKLWNKTAHPIILANMQYRIVKQFIERKQIFIAKKIKGGITNGNK